MSPSKKVKPTTALVADDHPLLRAGLRLIQDQDPSIQICGEATQPDEVIPAIKNLKPEVILLDIRFAKGDGLQCGQEVKQLPNPPKILFLTSYADNALVLEAIRIGAEGYLLKDQGVDHIAHAIHQVMNGQQAFDAFEPEKTHPLDKDPTAAVGSLSLQERRVLSAVAQGHSDKQIAEDLSLSHKTVGNYISRIFIKLHVNNRAAAAVLLERYLSSHPSPETPQ
jgi:DNA-binding NarL/FixJ family response regulator